MKTTCRSMTQPQGTAHAEHALTQLATRFEDWRHRRTSSAAPIPQSLWEQAVSLTAVLSISRVAQGIGVSWGTLKKRCTAQHSLPAAAAPSTTLGFVEVSTTAPWPVPTSGTEIELQRRDGTRLRIHSYEAHLPLATLLRTFLETPGCSSSPPRVASLWLRSRWISAKVSMGSPPSADARSATIP